MTTTNTQSINREYALLAPFFAIKLRLALQECHQQGYLVDLFEGYRSPERQDYLWGQGRERPGKIVTNAKAWQSWHQYGLACDIVGRIKGKWDWTIDYDKITVILLKHGFKPIEFEKPHFEITGGLTYREAKKIHDRSGLYALWAEVAKKAGN